MAMAVEAYLHWYETSAILKAEQMATDIIGNTRYSLIQAHMVNFSEEAITVIC
jgi:hypothetical protein